VHLETSVVRQWGASVLPPAVPPQYCGVLTNAEYPAAVPQATLPRFHAPLPSRRSSALLCSAPFVASCAVASRMSHAVRCASLAREFDIGAIDAATTTMLDQMASTSGRTQPTQPHLRRTQPHLPAVQASVPNVPPGRACPCLPLVMALAPLPPWTAWHVACRPAARQLACCAAQRRRPTASP
jgi:hypothetical protein